MHKAERQYFLLNGKTSWLFFIPFLMFVFSPPALFAQHHADSSQVLKKVTVTAEKIQNSFTSVLPVQHLNQEALLQINAVSIADAAKYFSGVLIKDYGGIGGLKTISVRSLGGLNTGLLYDGIVVPDAQTGQADLSKFSASFVQSLDLFQGNPPQLLLPARVYASSAILAFNSNSFNTTNFTKPKWQAGVRAGSFGLWQPYAGLYVPTGKNFVVSAHAEATWAGGHYPYLIKNGIFSQKAVRGNSDIQALQGEINVVKKFVDSSTLETKLWRYQSKRGLPGSTIYFNDIAVQRLGDRDFFMQSQYRKKFRTATALLLSAKYSSYYTRYQDPNFLNNNGGLDDRYAQDEWYGSAAVSQAAGKYFSFSLASDLASTHLSANIPSFPTPTRLSLWNSFAVQFVKKQWQITASVLNTDIHDKTENGTAATNKNKFTPAMGVSYKTSVESPFLFRLFYKDIFRMPTFNDLYYTYIANINPKLLPEYSDQYNAGVTYVKNFRGSLQQFSFSADGYYNSIKNKIIAVPSQNLFVWTMTNLGKVHIKGIDINIEAKGKFSAASRWTVRIAYTGQQALDVTDPSSAQYKNEIPYTPENSGSGLFAVYYKKWSASYSILFSGKRYALGENDATNALSGWESQDLLITKQISLSHFQTMLKAEVNNIFDTRYEVVRFYPMPGRSFKLSITFSNL